MVIQDRIRDVRLLSKVMAADEAVLLIQNNMTIATTGNAYSGFPGTLLLAMTEMLAKKRGKITIFCAGALGVDIENAFQKGDIVSKRLGSLGSRVMRKAVNEGRMEFLDVKSGLFPLQVARGDFGPVDVAMIEAVAITEEGNIVPSTALTDGARWVQCARKVLVEINPWIPTSLEGFHDVYLPEITPCANPIPLGDITGRIGTSFIPVKEGKIAAIVEATYPVQETGKSSKTDGVNKQIADNFIQFLEHQSDSGLLPTPLPPLEIGIGEVSDMIVQRLRDSSLKDIKFFAPGITESALNLMDEGKVRFISATNLRMGRSGLEHFFENIEFYRKHILLRPLDIINSGEIIRRMGVIALNTAIEVDIQGQVNSSHLMGVDIVGGIGGSYDYSRNALISIFLTPSTTKSGEISHIVPLVSHVDHTEHEVDVIITEQGLADLRGVEPMKRASLIIESCAHPGYRQALREYLNHAKERGSGRQPLFMEKAFSFHQRFSANKSMRLSS